jgi:hypothetical protein
VKPGTYIGEDGVTRIWDGKQFHTPVESLDHRMEFSQTPKRRQLSPSLLWSFFVLGLLLNSAGIGVAFSAWEHADYSKNSPAEVYATGDAIRNIPCLVDGLSTLLGKETDSSELPAYCAETEAENDIFVPDPLVLSLGLLAAGSVFLGLVVRDQRIGRRTQDQAEQLSRIPLQRVEVSRTKR